MVLQQTIRCQNHYNFVNLFGCYIDDLMFIADLDVAPIPDFSSFWTLH